MERYYFTATYLVRARARQQPHSYGRSVSSTSSVSLSAQTPTTLMKEGKETVAWRT